MLRLFITRFNTHIFHDVVQWSRRHLGLDFANIHDGCRRHHEPWFVIEEGGLFDIHFGGENRGCLKSFPPRNRSQPSQLNRLEQTAPVWDSIVHNLIDLLKHAEDFTANSLFGFWKYQPKRHLKHRQFQTTWKNDEQFEMIPKSKDNTYIYYTYCIIIIIIYLYILYIYIYRNLDSGFPEVPNTKVVSSCMLPQIWPVKLKHPNKKRLWCQSQC